MFFLITAMIQIRTGSKEPFKEKTAMHDLLVALAFIGMVVAPAIVAAKSGASDEGD